MYVWEWPLTESLVVIIHHIHTQKVWFGDRRIIILCLAKQRFSRSHELCASLSLADLSLPSFMLHLCPEHCLGHALCLGWPGSSVADPLSVLRKVVV